MRTYNAATIAKERNWMFKWNKEEKFYLLFGKVKMVLCENNTSEYLVPQKDLILCCWSDWNIATSRVLYFTLSFSFRRFKSPPLNSPNGIVQQKPSWKSWALVCNAILDSFRLQFTATAAMLQTSSLADLTPDRYEKVLDSPWERNCSVLRRCSFGQQSNLLPPLSWNVWWQKELLHSTTNNQGRAPCPLYAYNQVWSDLFSLSTSSLFWVADPLLAEWKTNETP